MLVTSFGLVIRKAPLTARVPDLAVFELATIVEQDGYIVTVHVPNPILLDKSRRKVYFMVDECESNSPREATRSSSE